MISRLRQYLELQDSGIEWLGDVPGHWTIERLHRSVQGCFNGIWGNDPNGHDDLICVRVADFDRVRRRVRLAEPTVRAIAPAERRHRLLENGDLLLEKSGGGDLQPVGIVVLYDHNTEAVCSNFIARMRVDCHYDSNFLVYLHSHLYAIGINVRSIKQTTGIQNLDASSYLRELVTFPPAMEQTMIAHFLRHCDRHIWCYIQARQRLIELLEELKTVIIQRAVTHGLDPDVRLNPTVTGWLNGAPEHWKVTRLKSVVSNIVEQTHERSKTDTYIAMEHVESWTGRVIEADQDVVFESQVKRFRSGDVLFGKLRPYLAKVSSPSQSGVCVGEFLVLRRIHSDIDPRYMEYLLRSKPVIDEVSRSTFGAKMPRADWSFMGTLAIAVPPLSEQSAIAAFLDRTTADLDAAVISVRREVSLFREYRTRLIGDVVTGKLDVREIAGRQTVESGASSVPVDSGKTVQMKREQDIDSICSGTRQAFPR